MGSMSPMMSAIVTSGVASFSTYRRPGSDNRWVSGPEFLNQIAASPADRANGLSLISHPAITESLIQKA
jgi:hypothetical protein